MARYNEILVGRVNRALQKLLGMKGDAVSPQLAGEIVPGVVIPLGAEFRYLEAWDRYGAFITQAAVAAQQGQIQLRNPAGSNVVAVFEKIDLSSGAADQPGMQIKSTGVDLATAITLGSNRFDNRSRPTPTLIASRTTAVLAAPTQYQGAIAANGTLQVIFTDIQEIPLLPGDAVQVQSNVVNQAFSASLWWRERFLEESERA